jgi:hypothetical protein
MKKESIYYFEKAGKENRDNVLKIAQERLTQGDIRHVVVATSGGDTALKLHELIGGQGVHIVAVGLHAGFRGGDQVPLPIEIREQLTNKEIDVCISSHSLSGISRSFSRKFGGISPPEIMAETLRLFCGHGVKVCVEISIMAADAGLVPTDEAILAIGGTHGGADTAITLKPAHQHNVLELEIKEMLAKPLSV